MSTGIDVSRWNGLPDWQRVRSADITFAYVKGGEGNVASYPTTDQHWNGAKQVGVKVGLYWYAKPALSPESNADAFAQQVNRLGAAGPEHLPPCLDLEEGTGHLGGWARRFVDRLRSKTGVRRVMVYSGAAFFRTQIGEAWMDPDVLLWIAHYGRPPGQPGYVSPRVVLHQYSQEGTVAGISGAVDLNVTMPSVALAALFDHQEDDVSYADAKRAFEDVLNAKRYASRVPGSTVKDMSLIDCFFDTNHFSFVSVRSLADVVRTVAQLADVNEAELAVKLGPVVASIVSSNVAPVVREVLGEDNAELAAQILEALGRKLVPTATQEAIPS